MPIHADMNDIRALAQKHLPKKTQRILRKRGGVLDPHRTRIAGLRVMQNNKDFQKVWGVILNEAREHEHFTTRKESQLKHKMRTIGRVQGLIEKATTKGEAGAGKSRRRPSSVIDGEKDRLTKLRRQANSIAAMQDRQKDFRERTRELSEQGRTEWRKRDEGRKANFSKHKQGPKGAPRAATTARPSIASRNVMRRPAAPPRAPR